MSEETKPEQDPEVIKDQAFEADLFAMLKDLKQKHGRELGLKLDYKVNGILPALTIVRSPAEVVEPKKVEEVAK